MTEEIVTPDPPGRVRPRRRLRRRTEEICEAIKDWIVEAQFGPGDRLPQERHLMEQFNASKSTVREALQALQTQGLIRTRTGPGGGAFVAAQQEDRAMELLGNYFFFKQPTIRDIYTMRKLLEPELAVSLVGVLTEPDFRRLEATMRIYDHPPESIEEEFQHRLAELDFNSVLAELCPNPVLGFVCGFLHNLLRNLTICRRIYVTENPELREHALHYQARLMGALRKGDSESARSTMYEHMCAAQRSMEACEAEVRSGFLRLDR